MKHVLQENLTQPISQKLPPIVDSPHQSQGQSKAKTLQAKEGRQPSEPAVMKAHKPLQDQRTSLLSSQNHLSLVQEDEFLPPIGRWSMLSGLFVMVTIGMGLTLASFANYTDTVKANAFVRPAEKLRISKDAPFQVKARVSPSDIGRLSEGQHVHVRVSACPYPDYGTLKGVVSQISEDTTSFYGSTFYEVTVEPDNTFLGRGNAHCPLRTGMEGRADIIVAEETVLKFLIRKTRLFTDF